MKKIYYWFIPIVLLMLVGTFFDLQISQWQDTVNQNVIIHSYYRFFEIFGEFALCLIFAISVAFFANFGYRKNGAIKWIQTILNGLGLLFFSTMEFVQLSRYLFPEGGNSHGTVTPTMYAISFVLGIILAVVLFKLMNRIKDEDYKHYRKVATMSLVYVIVLTIAVNGIKFIWARPRYWMVASGEATFVPWYIINGNNITDVTNAYMSFPSGHTANAFASLALSLWFVNKGDKLFNVFMIWGLLTAMSRIFAGQHYLTDTIMGGLLSFTLFVLLLKLFKLQVGSKTE